MAKDYVRTKNYITRFIEMKTHLNAVSLKIQVSLPNLFVCSRVSLCNIPFVCRLLNHMMQWQKR